LAISFDPSTLGTPDLSLNASGAVLEIFRPGAGLVYKPNATSNVIVLLFESVIEIDSNGEVISGNDDLSLYNFAINNGSSSLCPFQGLECADFQLNITINNSEFLVQVILFEQSGQITMGSNHGAYNVTAGTFKFQIQFPDGYNWDSSSNSIQVSISYRTISDSQPDVSSFNFTGEPNLNGTKPSAVDVSADNILLVLPQFAIIDGNDTAINVTVDAKKIESKIYLNIPYFSNSLLYDPIATESATTDDTNTNTQTVTESAEKTYDETYTIVVTAERTYEETYTFTETQDSSATSFFSFGILTILSLLFF